MNRHLDATTTIMVPFGQFTSVTMAPSKISARLAIAEWVCWPSRIAACSGHSSALKACLDLTGRSEGARS